MNNNENKELISQDILYDIIYNYIKPELNKCDDMISGHWARGSQEGVFYWHLHNDGARYRFIGSYKRDDHWEIYNDYFEEENVNIKVYSDHIEFIENSKFEDFSRDEMYSLYEFLKDKIFNNKEETKEDENVIDNKNNDVEIYTKDDYITKHNEFGVDDLKKYLVDHTLWIQLNNDLTCGKFSEFHDFLESCEFSHNALKDIPYSDKSIEVQEKIIIPKEAYETTSVILDNQTLKLSDILTSKPTFNKSILRLGMIIRFTLIDNRDIDDDDIFTEYDDCIGYITAVSDDYITIYNSCGLQCAPITIKREYLFDDDGTPTDFKLDIRIIDEEVLYNI